MIPIHLDTIHNIRDLGQTSGACGKRVKPGCLIRSAHLGNASHADIVTLKTLANVDTVIDLRTNQERVEKPDAADGMNCLSIPIFDSLQAGVTHEKRQKADRLPDMAGLYAYMMKDKSCQSNFRRALKVIMEHDYTDGSVLWHCSEGKDRCGMLTALVLLALGASRETILQDYLATNEINIPKAEAVYSKLRASHSEEFARSVYAALIADARYFDAAWEAMGADYLTVTLGIEPNEIQRFRDRMLE